jgi:indolepyruvate ferredoxin oxidoreductase
VLDELLRDLTPENLELAVQIAEIPESIRGFDSVKESQQAAAEDKQAELLATFRGRVEIG